METPIQEGHEWPSEIDGEKRSMMITGKWT